MFQNGLKKLAGVLAVAVGLAGCGGKVDVEEVEYTVLSSDVDGLFAEDGRIVRSAMITLQLEDRKPHTFQLEAARYVFKGEGDAMLAIHDVTDNTMALYDIGEENSSAAVTTSDGHVGLEVNADDTLSVDGVTYEDPGQAAGAILTAPAVASLTPEALAAADLALDALPEVDGSLPADKAPVKAAAKWVWKKILKHGVYILVKCNSDFACDPCVGVANPPKTKCF